LFAETQSARICRRRKRSILARQAFLSFRPIWAPSRSRVHLIRTYHH
jgi:hypothetical protein